MSGGLPDGPGRWYKPADVGEAGLTASLDWRGRIVSVGWGHPTHGWVECTAAPPLRESARYDQAAVRRYRKRLSAPDAPAFGLQTDGVVPTAVTPQMLDGGILRTSEPSLVSFAVDPDIGEGTRALVQLRMRDGGDAGGTETWRWSGRLRLGRASFPQLTEGGPLKPLSAQPAVRSHESGWVLSDGGLASAVALAGDVDGGKAELRGESVQVDIPMRPRWRKVVLAAGPDAAMAAEAASVLADADPDELLVAAVERWRTRWAGWPADNHPLDALARRGIAYALTCCAIPVGETTCLVTDHRLLPLAWTRDGYFVARALLDWNTATGCAEGAMLVRRHLAWLFGRADCPAGWWARSHLVGGQRKDPAFQVDQQLWPLVELADYVDVTGDRTPLDQFRDRVEAVLRAVQARRDPATGLYATDETAADDRTDLPYLAANQILAWHALRRVSRLGIGHCLEGDAEWLRDSITRHFVTTGPSGNPLIAYATGGRGQHRLYHDANDFPLALAPVWGFLAADDPLWLETIGFAFSAANPGYAAGPHGGLGSVHTPGPWPLGHLQARTVAALTDEQERMATADAALGDAAAWDGSLPEANDPLTGQPTSRPWFAWPGAVAASLRLKP